MMDFYLSVTDFDPAMRERVAKRIPEHGAEDGGTR
jgi:hypothetical protein